MVATLPRTKPQPELDDWGLGGGDDHGRHGDDGSGRKPSLPPGTHRLGLWIGLCSITMLFIALTSAYVVRQGLGGDWQPVRMPRLLWLTTAVLLGSSLTLELARSAFRESPREQWYESERASSYSVRSFRGWMTLTLILGIIFLLGQLLAWRYLAAQGVYLNTSPHSSFFYLLTGAHGVHLFGGLCALVYVVLRAWHSGLDWRGPDLETALNLTALYWHFMDGLWIYLLIVLFVFS